MALAPRRDADHELVLESLALLAIDCPQFGAVIRSVMVTLYGVRATATAFRTYTNADSAEILSSNRAFSDRPRG